MADNVKVLNQLTPGAGLLIDTYTVPAVVSAVISSVVVCNQSANPTTFRISVAIAGAGDSTKQYLYYDTPINGNSVLTITLGITLATLDVVRTYSASGNVSFNVFGAEVTPL